MNMKRLFPLLLVLLSSIVMAQAPQAIKYQTVVRSDNGTILPQQQMDFKISILEGSATGTTVYTEEHFLATNPNGMASFKIGLGTVVSGAFNTIDWGSGPHFVKVEARISGAPSYNLMGIEEFASVPYAFFAANTEDSELLWQQNDNDIFYMGGNVGIKTNTPTEALTIGQNNRMQLSTTKNTLTYGAVMNLLWKAPDAKPGIHFQDAAGVSKVALSAYDYLSYPNEQAQRFSIATTNEADELTERLVIPYGENDVDIQITNSNLLLTDGNTFQVGTEENDGLAMYYGDVFINGTKKLGIGDKDWAAEGTYQNAQLEIYRASSDVEFLIHDDAGTNQVGLHLRNGEYDWKMIHDGDFRITYEEATHFKITSDGDVGIDVEEPIAKLDVNGNINVSSGFAYLTGGSGKASYLPVSDPLEEGDILGMNPNSGMLRKFQAGDIYMGVVVKQAGFIDNYSRGIEDNKSFALVVTKGQVDIDLSQVQQNGRMISIEGQNIGVLMANGKIYLK
jgi:hypothetical protein